jgi:hypothetical protein
VFCRENVNRVQRNRISKEEKERRRKSFKNGNPKVKNEYANMGINAKKYAWRILKYLSRLVRGVAGNMIFLFPKYRLLKVWEVVHFL